ncbi:MAG: glycohydrolase toxin TNT-related protein, partial [Eubacterium sp.]|nr:glycohydrolase toxin TNT-related protein [Eubacterium sp.]
VAGLTGSNSGSMITYRYDAYGNTTKSNNTLNNPYQYNAEYTDSSTGLQYLRARYYDSSQGRFTTKDTLLGSIEKPITLNLYTYCGNNPLNYIDPSGHVKIGKSLGFPKNNFKTSLSNVKSTVKTQAKVTVNKAKYIAVANSPNATSAEKTMAYITYMQSKATLAMHMAMKKACSKTDKIKIASSTNKITFREKVRNETGLDIYALGNSALALGGAVGSAAAMGLGILAAPETGGASLALTAFGFGSLAFACSDLSQYLSDVYVGKDGEFRHGTENRSYNTMHDGLFNGNTTAYNNVRTFTDLGTTIFSIGTAAVTTPKTPTQKINDTANRNKGTVVSSSPSVDDFIEQNVAPDFQKSVKNAFSSDAKVTTLSKDTTVYRYYGDGANPKSYWYTPNKTSNPVGDLALPGQNSAQYVEKYIIPKGTTVLEGTVAPNFGQPGGGYQYYV